MTIASAFNEIAVAQGGTAAKSGAITAAIDALNDALAGSDQPTAKTIEQAVRLLGEHIGGGGGGASATVYIAAIGIELGSGDVSLHSGDVAVALEAATVTIPDGGSGTEEVPAYKATVPAGQYLSAHCNLAQGVQLVPYPVIDPTATLPSIESIEEDGTSVSFVSYSGQQLAIFFA